MEKIIESQTIVEPEVSVESQKTTDSRTADKNSGKTDLTIGEMRNTIRKRTVWFDWG